MIHVKDESEFLLLLNSKFDMNAQEKNFKISLERKLIFKYKKSNVLMSDFKLLVWTTPKRIKIFGFTCKSNINVHIKAARCLSLEIVCMVDEEKMYLNIDPFLMGGRLWTNLFLELLQIATRIGIYCSLFVGIVLSPKIWRNCLW